ncbi:MAG TPA: F0F1 ATP synthase subunit B [Nitrospiria bacterium]|nr:F0F1 ATP synthase subunit B [Nitrospiria bacterium]
MKLEIQQVITQIIGFLILLWILRRFAWGKLTGLLDERRNKIASEFAEIERTREEIAQERKAFEGRLAEIENTARQKVAEAVLEGQRVAREITDAAREESRKLVEKARENIVAETAAAKQQLKEEVARLSITIAEKILRQQIDEQKNRKLVMEMIDRVEELR